MDYIESTNGEDILTNISVRSGGRPSHASAMSADRFRWNVITLRGFAIDYLTFSLKSIRWGFFYSIIIQPITIDWKSMTWLERFRPKCQKFQLKSYKYLTIASGNQVIHLVTPGVARSDAGRNRAKKKKNGSSASLGGLFRQYFNASRTFLLRLELKEVESSVVFDLARADDMWLACEWLN